MKQFKPVIIALALLVVLAVLALVVVKLFPEDAPVEVPYEEEDISAIKIVDCEIGEVESIELFPRDGENFVLDCDFGGKGVSIRGESGKFPFDAGKLSSTLSRLVPLLALEEIGEDDGTSFGFDNSPLSFNINLKNGERIALTVGADTPLGDGVYIRRADINMVYTISTATRDILFLKRDDYRDITLFERLEDSSLISEVTLKRPGKADISVREKTAAEKKVSSDYSSNYMIVSPVVTEAHVDNIFSHFLDKVNDIRAVELCEDNPKNLSKYGLDNPTKISFKARDGKETITLLIGKRTENGGNYVMREGIPTVVRTSIYVDFESFNHSDIAMGLIWLYSSEDVKKVTFQLNGEKHTLDLDFRNGTLYGKYDGVETQGKNATHLYTHVIRFSIEGEFVAGTKYKDPAIKMTIELKNGKRETLELCEINERHYAAKRNGKEPDYYVNVTELRELLNCLEIIKAGGEVPALV